MHARLFRLALGLILFLSLCRGQAYADATDGIYSKGDWPLRVIERPLTLAAGMLEIRGDTMRINLSRDSEGEPITLAPDVFFGVSKDLSIGITHEIGICLTGESGGCPETYDDVGLEALYSLMHGGSFQVAARGGILLPRLSGELTAGINLGLIARLTAGKFAIVLEPQLYVGALGRDPDGMVPVLGVPGRPIGPKETISMPGAIKLQLNQQTNVFLSSGVVGPLDGFGDAYQVPIGFGAVFAINHRLDLGGEFRFFNIAGKNGDADFREVVARLALRL